MGWLSRFVVALSFLAIGIIFSPETFKSDNPDSSSLSSILKLSHLLCFSTAWGAALWATFIGGIIMFKNLPRHQFGNLQSKMFPAYFTLVGVCCAVSTASFGYLHPWKSSSSTEKYQLGFLGFAFLFNLSNLLVFTPMTIKMMKQRHKIERENNIGEEVGWTKNKEVAKKNPQLAAMNKKFGMPLPESVALVEDIVVEYVTDLAHKAQDVASKRGRLMIEDFLFIIRKDFPKLNRATELLAMNEELKQARKAFDMDEEKLVSGD